MDKLEHMSIFTTTVYVINKPDFLESVRAISNKYLDQSNSEESGDSFVRMTGSYAHEESITEFTQYVSQTAWNILSSQGYAMETLATYFTEMWTQEHKKYSSMDYHSHGHGSQISAFYFLDVPENSNSLIIYDPRQSKTITQLPQKNDKEITSASSHVIFTPKEGMLIFTNAWLPHSFTKNMNDLPMRFVHMNLSIASVPAKEHEVEVV